MKKILLLILIIVMLSSYSIFAAGFSIFAGMSTPNDKINDVYNGSSLLFEENSVGTLVSNGTKIGYHIGARLSIPLSPEMNFNGGIAWNRFPETEIGIKLPNQDTITLKTVQNIIPISVGVSYYFVRSVIGVYALGDLTYNLISSTVDYKKEDITIPLNLNTAPSDSRVGFSLGAGIEIDAKLLGIFLEAKYNIANMIGQTGDEKSKAFYTLSLGVRF